MRVNFNSVPAATFGKRLSDENVKVIAEPGGFSGYLLKGAVFFFSFLKNYFASWFRVLEGSRVCVAIYDFCCIMILASDFKKILILLSLSSKEFLNVPPRVKNPNNKK